MLKTLLIIFLYELSKMHMQSFLVDKQMIW
ncbi:hypothetical protein [Staphylococcus pseudoxylosus]